MKTLLCFIAAAAVILSRPAIAGLVDFTADSSLSTITVSGTFQSVPLAEQIPGSSTAHYEGIFLGDMENGLLSIFANNTVSLRQAVPLQPIPADDWGGLGAYGFRVVTPASGEVLLAITGFSFYLNTLYDPPLDIADGTFAAADLGFFLRGDTLMLSAPTTLLDYVDLHGVGSPNQSALPGTFTSDGALETLTIPILATFSLTAFEPDDLTLKLSGQIVATRPVPEPSTTLLLLGSGAALAWRRRCRTMR